MKPNYKKFEEAENALTANSYLKNKEIIEKETGKTRLVSSLVIFPYTLFEGKKEVTVGYDVVVYFKNEMKFVLLNEIEKRFSLAPQKVTLDFV